MVLTLPNTSTDQNALLHKLISRFHVCMFGLNCYSHGLINRFTIFNLISTLCSWVLSGDFVPFSRGRIPAPFPIKNSHLFPNNMSDFSQLRKKKSTFFRDDVCMFCCFTSQVNSFGHGGTVSSPNNSLEQAFNHYFVHILSLVTDNNPSSMIQQKEGE